MNVEDISRIQGSLEIKLPDQYCRMLANYPYPDAECRKLHLLGDADSIIQQNTELRKSGYSGFDWPSGFIAIGHDGCGCIWFIQADDPRCNVYYADFNEDFPPPDPNYEFDDFVLRMAEANPFDDGPLPILKD